MIKLRFKIPTNPDFLVRAQPNANDSGLQLKQWIRQEIFKGEGPPEAEYKLSINKKDELVIPDSSTLASLGFRSGDVVWILHPIPSAMAPQPAAGQPSAAPPAAPVTPPVPEPSTAEPESPPAKLPKPHEEDFEDVGMDVDVTVPQGPAAPDRLLRVLSLLPPGVPPAHLALVAAAHAAMLESGFAVDPEQGNTILDSKPGGLYTQSYIVPQLQAQAAVPMDTGATQGPPQPAVTCVLKCVEMGSFLLVHGGVLLGSRPATVKTLQLLAAEHVHAGPLSADAADEGPRAALQSFADIKRLWTLLKDGLALPLLAAVYHGAGQEAPVSLLTMPFELKQRILGSLKAKDLASLCCSCSEMRHLAATDQLWKPLYMHDFPQASQADHQEAERRGWKAAYGVQEQRRRALEDARRRQRLVRPPHFPPFPGPLPGAPHPLRMPIPGVIGGDYDRFPAPFLGQGPGVFPGQGLGGMGIGGGPMFRSPGGIRGDLPGGLHFADLRTPPGGPMFPGMHSGSGRRGDFRLS